MTTHTFIRPHRLIGALLLGLLPLLLQAQAPDSSRSRLYTGYGFELSYNLYSRNRLPSLLGQAPHYSGQALNLLPGVGLSWWLGDVDRWTAAVSAELEWLPFQLSLGQYQGLGAWRLPLLARVQVPVWKQQSLWIRVSAGLGAQYQALPLYDWPEGHTPQPAYWSAVSEIGLQVAAVGTHRQRIRAATVFLRWGAGLRDAQSWHLGLRVVFWNRLRKNHHY